MTFKVPSNPNHSMILHHPGCADCPVGLCGSLRGHTAEQRPAAEPLP